MSDGARVPGESALFGGEPLAVVTRTDRRSGLERAESVHAGHLVVVAGGTEAAVALGDPDAVVYIRSAAKPVQASACLELAGRAAEDLSDEEVAVAWASHRGEGAHLAAVRRLLERSGTPPRGLTCPPARPEADPSAAALPLHHNCSGKHALFALAGAARSVPRAELLDPDGALQRSVLGALADVFGPPAAVGTDGCGAPAVAVPLIRLAAGYRRLLTDGRFDRVVRAGLAHPALVGGTGRLESVLLSHGVLAKVGAAGIYAAAWVSRERVLGAAVKAADGDPRGAGVALWRLARRTAGVPADAWSPEPPLGGGDPAGTVAPTADVVAAAEALEGMLHR